METPGSLSKQPGSAGFMPVTSGSRPPPPNRPAPPSPSQQTPANPSPSQPYVDSTTARLELAQALEALKSNSKKLETKLEKIETTSTANLQPAVEMNFVPSSDVSPIDVKQTGFESSTISRDNTTITETTKRYGNKFRNEIREREESRYY